jgi:8-oxo-dGTP diphosphatase
VPRQVGLDSHHPRIHVVAGILVDEKNRVLIADRLRSGSMQDHWEFPGGKVILGESPETALRRELSEELGIEVITSCHFKRIEHDYPDLRVAIDFYLVDEWLGIPIGAEGQQIKWAARTTLHQQNLLPADAPIIGALNQR